MPREYYLDWLQVAAEEAGHFSLLRTHLQTLGYDYGDFPAHTGLWDMTEGTATCAANADWSRSLPMRNWPPGMKRPR